MMAQVSFNITNPRGKNIPKVGEVGGGLRLTGVRPVSRLELAFEGNRFECQRPWCQGAVQRVAMLARGSGVFAWRPCGSVQNSMSITQIDGDR